MLGSLLLAKGEVYAARCYFMEVESTLHDAETAFQLACVEARAGNHQESLSWLEKAFQRGFNDRERVLSSGELREVRQLAAT